LIKLFAKGKKGNKNIEALIAQMTLEEKISLLAGADFWRTIPVKRLGIPAVKVTDGPIGARGTDFHSGVTSACFPCGTALAATWDPDLVERVGKALADEVKSKGAHILLAPTVNIHRSPLAGRNFECYSEDPYLTACLAVAYINGLQSEGVGACIKHFVCNDSEFERQSISSEVSERALREIYLRPFQIAIREARPWSVMSSYNRINGTYASENDYTLLDILKGEWGFDGLVMSDWFGTYSPDVAKGGLDLEMPGPARWMGEHALQAAKRGELSLDRLNDKARRLLRTIEKVGAFAHPDLQPEQTIDRPEHRRLAREAASEAIVLLKNDNMILPLDLDKLRSIAVIGANARWASFRGDGSVRVNPHYVIAPLDAIKDKAGDKVSYAVGCAIHKLPRLLDKAWLTGGLTAQYFSNRDLAGNPVHTEVTDKLQQVGFGDAQPHVELTNFSVRLTGTFTVPEGGAYELGLSSVGPSRLFIDGVQIVNLWDSAPHGRDRSATGAIELVAGQVYQLKIEYAAATGSPFQRLSVGCMPQIPADSIQQAADLAARSDVAIVFAGLTHEWESEGYDRPDMELPRDQAELIERVAAANPNTIVVLNAGSAVSMNWLNKVAAVVQAWYLGQETGNAIADVLFGDVNPSGKLPTTFPKRLQDNPAYLNYPGENGKVYYGEGLFVGYRYYDKKDIAPLFPFGYGLSYTTFAYSNLVLSATEYGAGNVIRMSVDVQNTGQRAGKEIVQVYLRDVQSRLVRPEKELKAFAKVALKPGEIRTVTFTLDQEALSYYDPAVKGWVAEVGEFQVLVGSSSRDIRLTAHFNYRGEAAPGLKKTARLHVGLSLGELLADAGGKAVLEKHIGTHLNHPMIETALDMSLEQIAPFAADLLTPDLLKAINDDLARV
jgi:beta-glucosidase